LLDFKIDVFDPDGQFIYQLELPPGNIPTDLGFTDNSVFMIKTEEDRDVYEEYLIKNLPGVF
jgi:hypothetical protein